MSYSLKPKGEPLQSYFQYEVVIRNRGDEAVEGFTFTMEVKESEVILVKPPTIKSEPEPIRAGLGLKQDEKVESRNKDQWEVSLLNPGEAVVFSYTAYSTTRAIPKVDFNPVVRKSNWTVVDWRTTSSPRFSSLLAAMMVAVPLSGFLAAVMVVIASFVIRDTIGKFKSINRSKKSDNTEELSSKEE